MPSRASASARSVGLHDCERAFGARAGACEVADRVHGERLTKEAACKLVRPVGGRQPARGFEELCGCVLRSSSSRLSRGRFDLRGGRLVCFRRALRQMTTAFLEIGDHLCEAPVDLSASLFRGRSVDDGREQRMREAETPAHGDEDARLLRFHQRTLEVNLGTNRGADSRHGGA